MIENELRLGNYLLGYDNNYFTWDYGHYNLCSKGIYADELGMSIELTEEILLKCGFVKEDLKPSNKHSNYFSIWINDYKYSFSFAYFSAAVEE